MRIHRLVPGLRAVAGRALAAATLLLTVAACERSPRAADAPTTADRAPLVAKVEHFYATAPDAERLFHVFRDSLGLAQSWGFQAWGDFASGGVSLGNVAFELTRWTPEDGSVLPTELSGIAFEPVGHTDSLVAELRRRGIAHGRPDTNTYETASGRLVGWVNTGLTGMLPQPRDVFFCDYTDRAMVAASRQRGVDSLRAAEGGPLGVLAVREIVVGAPDLDAARARWRRLLDAPTQEAGDLFRFGAGPGIRLVSSSDSEIRRMVVQVRSLERARAFLAARGWLGDTTAHEITIAPALIGGLHVALVE